jgi:uncharacterized MAPEG superfamily protein
MAYIHLIAVLAALQLVFFGIMTGGARQKSGLKAPATTGDEQFERMHRVQMNTLELIPIFLIALFVAGFYWSQLIVAGIGSVYLIGRFIYWRAYVKDPTTRALGFALSMLPSLVLLIMALAGIVMSLF